MGYIGMDEAAGDEPVVLFSFRNSGWIKNKIIQQFSVIEGYDGKDTGKYKYDKCYRHGRDFAEDNGNRVKCNYLL